jgi:hypothetical protein
MQEQFTDTNRLQNTNHKTLIKKPLIQQMPIKNKVKLHITKHIQFLLKLSSI